MEQAAQEYSLDPAAKLTQGDMGWVNKGTGLPGLDELIFKLEAGVVSDPVESHAGWYLVKVLAVIEPQLEKLDDPQTHERTFRAYMQDRLNTYVTDLRNKHFDVVVYQDELNRQFKREADFIAELSRKEQEESPVTGQPIEEMQKWMSSPTQQ